MKQQQRNEWNCKPAVFGLRLNGKKGDELIKFESILL